MSNVIKFKKPTAAEKHKGKSLCRHGRHRWKIEAESVFDVKEGKLVTRFVCERCGKQRIKAI